MATISSHHHVGTISVDAARRHCLQAVFYRAAACLAGALECADNCGSRRSMTWAACPGQH
eukprot:256786-Chlamydomonas_euryale.AAC.1